MIIITGPGRSGTSVVAKLNPELGFDPGGRWISRDNAGFEAAEIVRVNRRIIADLGMGALGPPMAEAPLPPQRIARVWKRIVPARIHEQLRSMLHRLPPAPSRRQGSMRWDLFDEMVHKYRSTLHEVSRLHEVVKDPLFCWTLGVWAAAGVEIDHVLVCTRSLYAIVRSRSAAGHLRFRSKGEAKTSLVYGLGLSMTALYDYQLSYSVIRFPDFPISRSPREPGPTVRRHEVPQARLTRAVSGCLCPSHPSRASSRQDLTLDRQVPLEKSP